MFLINKKLLIVVTVLNFFGIHADITVQFGGQMGNRMFQFAVAYAVAKEKQEPLCVPQDEIHDVFNIPSASLHSPYLKRFNYSEASDQRYDSSIFLVPNSTNLIGFFQTDKYFLKYRDDLIKMFTFKDESIKRQTLEFLDKIDKPVVCMHFRGGDYFISGFPILDYDYYIKAIRLSLEILDKKPKECAFVMISNDDGNYIRPLINKIKDSIKGIEIINYDVNSKLLDFSLMKESDICITSASSFSWWAAWLNTECRAIISPKYWFNYYKNNGITSPFDVNMSLKNQFLISSEGFFHNL